MLLNLLIYAAFAAQPFDTCRPKIDAEPLSGAGYACVYNEVRRTGAFDEAIDLLRGYVEADPARHWGRLTLANTLSAHDDDACLEHYEKARKGFAETGEAKGEVYANLGMRNRLNVLGREAEANARLDDALSVARASDNVQLKLVAASEEARHLWRQGATSDAVRVAEAAREDAMNHGTDHVKLIIMHTLAGAYLEVGRVDEAWAASEEVLELTRSQGNRYVEATERANMLEMLDNHPHLRPDWTREVAHAFATETLALAQEVGNTYIVPATYCQVARYAPDETAQRAGYEACLDSATAGRNRYTQAEALRELAALETSRAPERAKDLADQAVEEAARSGSRWEHAEARLRRAQVLGAIGDVAGADAEFLAVMSLVERDRDLQNSELAQAGLSGNWTGAYAGAIRWRLDHDDLEGAWAISERRRGRILLSSLDQTGVSNAALAEHPEREALLEEIRGLEDHLWDDLTEDERSTTLEQIATKEDEEKILRVELAGQDPAFSALFEVPTPTVAEVQAALDPDQVLLAFQLPWLDTAMADPVPGSIVVIDSDGATTLPLNVDPRLIEKQITMFSGMLADRTSEGEQAAAQGLYRQLLGDLQTTRHRWIVIPDGALFRLPFAALVPPDSDEPLATSHEVTVVGSAALWLRLRQQQAEPPSRSVLVVADPAFPPSEELKRLPWASKEGRRLAKRFGESSTLLTDADATRAALISSGPQDHAVLHFAAHAVIDHDPSRSALLLAPDADHDGRLTAEQITELDLDGRAVVLSVCSSEGGPIVGAEGAFGLGRAFLHAGARTVVASNWPLRDDDAAALFDAFSSGLQRGASVAAALSDAQRQLRTEGLPPAAWAGVFVLGDGDYAPFTGSQSPAKWWLWLIWLPAATLLAGGLTVFATRGR